MIIECITFFIRLTQKIFEFLGLTPLIVFIIKKSLWYGFLFFVAFVTILRAYFSYIP